MLLARQLPLQNGCATVSDYWEAGYRVLPLVDNTKRPAMKGSGRLKRFIERSPQHTPEDYLLRVFTEGTRYNIGVILPDNVVVVDIDSDDPCKVELLHKHYGESPMRSQTPSSGQHHWYRLRAGTKVQRQVQIKSMPYDLVPPGTYSVESPSEIDGVPYRWLTPLVPPHRLPIVRISWLRERRKRRMKHLFAPESTGADEVRQRLIARATGYVANIEGAISGQRGHDKTFRVACVLLHKFRLTIDEAWPIFKLWNETCEPPWTENELTHKLEGALRCR